MSRRWRYRLLSSLLSCQALCKWLYRKEQAGWAPAWWPRAVLRYRTGTYSVALTLATAVVYARVYDADLRLRLV